MVYAIKNIIVLIDYSETSVNALNIAIQMAKRQGACLHLVEVIDSLLVMNAGIDPNDSRKQLEKYAEKIKNEHNIKTETYCEIGAVAKTINGIIIKSKIDLVVIGTQGSTGWMNFLVGNEAMSIIKHAICPVLIIPHTFTKTSFSQVLYPVRSVKGVIQKYDYVKPIIEKNNSFIHLLGIANKENFNEMEGELKKLTEMVPVRMDYLSNEKIVAEDISNKILEISKQRNTDLLVINATLDKNWKEIFSESYTQQIINHAKCPVLCIKPDLTAVEIEAENYYLVTELAYNNIANTHKSK
jgi:nucleotide-binding universal stress UspA family protein